MRASVLLATAAAAGVLATPLQQKRGDVVVTEVEYTTAVVTVYEAAVTPEVEADIEKRAKKTTTKKKTTTTTKKKTTTAAAAVAVDVVKTSSTTKSTTKSSTTKSTSKTSSTTKSTAKSSSTTKSTSKTSSTTKSTSKSSSTTKSTSKSSTITSKATTSSTSAGATLTLPTTTATVYSQAALEIHNIHRANHSASALTWNKDLASAALIDAKKCEFTHFAQTNASLPAYGQNLAAGLPPGQIGAMITEQWYAEVTAFAADGDYGEAQPDYGTDYDLFATWGHFTQVVWKASTELGCATWECDAVYDPSTGTNLTSAISPILTYCFYASPGNYANEYAENVGEPLTTETISANALVNPTAIAKAYSSVTGQEWTD